MKNIFYRKKDKVTGNKPLTRIDNNDIDVGVKDVLLFAKLRNEALRLPHFIDYYKNLGVNNFFFVDNNSDDNSREIILDEPSAYLFYTEENFKNNWFWMEYLIEMYGLGHWCLVVDIDELFTYPNSERINLHLLANYMEQYSYTSISSLLLDMYSEKDFGDINYRPGQNPLASINYFDTSYEKTAFTFPDRKNKEILHINGYTGGMRERVFGRMIPADILTKISFFKHDKSVYLVDGMHAISNTKSADLEGVVFHTKFLDDFPGEVFEESKREQHYDNAIRYKHFEKSLIARPNFNLHFEGSVKLQSQEQLIDLGLMKTSSCFEEFCSK